MKGSIIWLAAFLFIIGCSDKPGRGILEEKQMIHVMWDLMQADEFAAMYLSRDSSVDLQKQRFRLYADVYRINGVDEKTFSASYKYYIERPDQMKKIFDSLTTKGEKERQLLHNAVDSAAAKPLSVADSLKKDSLQVATRVRDSLKTDSIKKAVITKPVLPVKDSSVRKINQQAGKARQIFLMDSLRKARIRKNQKSSD